MTEQVSITKDEFEAELPPRLAELLIKHRGWEVSDEDADKINVEEAEPAPVFVGRAAREATVEEEVVEAAAPVIIEEAVEAVTEPEESAKDAPAEPVTELNPEAECDDDLPEGIVFADSAYETVVDEETGEEVRVLKTHCRNGHAYAGNVKIRVRGDKAYRECQTCLKGRRTRANEKEKAERAAAKKAPAKRR